MKLTNQQSLITNPEEKILIAGFGGQGTMFLGKVLAEAAVLEKKAVTYIRSYGAEMRGGTANCLLRLSKGKIFSPVFEKATSAIIMNEPSWRKFKARIEKRGFLLLNSSLIKNAQASSGINLKKVPLNDLALKIGSLRVANIIALGVFLREKRLIKVSSAEKILKTIFKENPQLLELNLEALRLGFNYYGKN